MFEAKYAGRCGDCQEKINVGDLCHYVDDEVCHESCQGQHTINRAKAEVLCPNCFMYHKGECL